MKASVKSNILFITSDYSIDDLKKVAKYRPDAMKLVEGEGDEKHTVAAICVGTKSSVAPNGIVFAPVGGTTGKAVVTMELPTDCDSEDEVRNYIHEKVGMTVINGTKIEAQVADALASIDADFTAMDEAITIEG